MLDLLQTGKYGVLTQQQLLGTTSNNISNVSTNGYIRKETLVYTSAVDWGIGSTVTRRLYDQYAQREMFRDQGNVGFYDAYSTGLSTVDKLLSGEDTSISSAMSSLFASMHTAVQNTPSAASRQELLTQFETLVDRYHTLNYNIQNELNDINSKAEDAVVTINDLVESFYNVNQKVRNLSDKSLNSESGLALLDERDRLIGELSNYVDLSVTTEEDGSYTLYLGNGQLLASGDTYAVLDIHADEFDPTRREVSIIFQTPAKQEIKMDHGSWGGKLGGYLSASDEMRQAMRDLGQTALAFADAMNEQNKGGITLENKAGKDLITIPEVKASSNKVEFGMTVVFNDGEGSDIRNCDYEVSFNDDGDLEIYTIDGDGNRTKLDTDDINQYLDDPLVSNEVPLEIPLEGHGITLRFDHSANQMRADTGDKLIFKAQPTLNAGYNIKLNITKPEEFAFSSAVRVHTNGHAGNAVAELVGVYGSDTVANSTEFGIYVDANGDAQFTDNAPNYVRFETSAANPQGEYVIYHAASFDADGNPVNPVRLGAAPASCNGQSIFDHANWDTAYNFVDGFPNYDVNFTGTVQNGSSFYLELNTDGYNDNSNGNLLAQLQQENLVFSTESVRTTFTEAYADLTSAVGSTVMSATTDLKAAHAKFEQSQNLFSSAAGVNLDEEAANLIRFQQSYSACARIISASQTVFNSLLSSLM